MSSHSLADERATNATTGSVSLILKTSCGTPGLMYEIAGCVFHDLLEPGAEFVAHFAFHNVKDHFEADMNMRRGHATRRNGGDVGREFCRAHVFGGHALLVMNAIPIPTRAPATNGQYPVVIFDHAELDIVFLHFLQTSNFEFKQPRARDSFPG
jgi:hypothetical protein